MRKKRNLRSKFLSGIRVLVGRARHQAGALSGELRKLGAKVIEIPFIEIRRPRSFKPLDAALKNLGSYDWLILTSVNGVEAMWERLDKLPLRTTDIKSLHIAAIGPATQKAIERRGMKVDVVPKEYVAESVVRSLKKQGQGKARAPGTRQSRSRRDSARTAEGRSPRRRCRSLRNRRAAEFPSPFAGGPEEPASPRRDLHQLFHRAQFCGTAGRRQGCAVGENSSRAGAPAPHRARRNSHGVDRPGHFRNPARIRTPSRYSGEGIYCSRTSGSDRAEFCGLGLTSTVSSVVNLLRYSVTEQLQSAGTTCASRKLATRL